MFIFTGKFINVLFIPEGQINPEESFNGEMKEDVVNVLIEVENTGPIEQKVVN